MFNLFLFIVLASIATSSAFFVVVPEGHVGVYTVLGQIQNTTIKSLTGFIPIYSDIRLVKYIQDNDHVHNVNCVSNEGVNLKIPDIEIANRIDPDRLIDTIRRYQFDYDKKLVVNPLAQYMRELCAKRTVDQIEISDFDKLDDLLKIEIQRQNDELKTGIIIDYVRVTSVIIPDEIKEKRLELAKEKANKILAEEKMKRLEIEKASEVLVAKRNNDILEENAKRENHRVILNAEAEREKRQIENAILLESTQTNVQRIHLEAVANAEKMKLEAEALKELYSISGYADVEKTKHILDKTSMIYFGDKVPAFLPYGTNLNTGA
jgi:regulator of protease activity HflC (stomatin/prohibitin superfamily)